jgi:GSH-dependent disulfide-bond oxidoreductase
MLTYFSNLSRDETMLKFYYNTAPNPAKVALFLEESGLPYEIVPIDTRKGEQHLPAFKAINPNAKLPAIVDGEVTVPSTPALKAEMQSWLMFVASGIGPYSGQAVHFKHFAPEPKEYAVNRYDFEAWRHWNILNERLANHSFMVGDSYSIVDMAIWGWARAVPFVLGTDAWEKLPNVKRLLDTINARPAAQRAEALKTKYTFKTEMDDEAKKAMFPQNERLKK